MKRMLAVAFAFLMCPLGGHTEIPLSTLIAELPSCGFACIVTAISNSPCTLTNQTCLCANALFKSNVTACVLDSCTIREALTTQNITTTTCEDPIRDKSQKYKTLTTVLGTIAGVTVGLRLLSKLVTHSTFWLDDYLILITLLVGIPSSVPIIYYLTPKGLGQDIWTLHFQHVTDFLHAFYVMEILYFSLVSLFKLSILFFYLRIFPGTRFRQLLWGTIIFNTLFGVIFVFAAIFQCHPVDHYWTQWDGEHNGKCLNLNAMAWANAAISIAIDIWMLVLPISQIIRLKIHWKDKVSIGLMFGVGTVITIISILRLHTLTQFANTQNPTWDFADIALWSTTEICIGIICACMPSLRIFLVHLFPRIFKASQHSKSGYYVHDSSHIVSGNALIDRSRHRSITSPSNKGEIIYSQSYTVRHEIPWDHKNAGTALASLDAVYYSKGLATKHNERTLSGSEIGSEPV